MFTPTPIVRLQRAVAAAEVDGPAAALAAIEPLPLAANHHFHAVRADLLRRLGRDADAAAAYEIAIELCRNDVERDFLRRARSALR